MMTIVTANIIATEINANKEDAGALCCVNILLSVHIPCYLHAAVSRTDLGTIERAYKAPKKKLPMPRSADQ